MFKATDNWHSPVVSSKQSGHNVKFSDDWEGKFNKEPQRKRCWEDLSGGLSLRLGCPSAAEVIIGGSGPLTPGTRPSGGSLGNISDFACLEQTRQAWISSLQLEDPLATFLSSSCPLTLETRMVSLCWRVECKKSSLCKRADSCLKRIGLLSIILRRMRGRGVLTLTFKDIFFLFHRSLCWLSYAHIQPHFTSPHPGQPCMRLLLCLQETMRGRILIGGGLIVIGLVAHQCPNILVPFSLF